VDVVHHGHNSERRVAAERLHQLEEDVLALLPFVGQVAVRLKVLKVDHNARTVRIVDRAGIELEAVEQCVEAAVADVRLKPISSDGLLDSM